MIEFRFGIGDLATTSFAYSPLQEAVFSLRCWRHPNRYPYQRPWLRRLRPLYERQDTELLDALVMPTNWIADFLTPRPTRVRPDFGEELQRLRATPVDVLREDFRRSCGEGGEVPPLVVRGLARPEAFLERIAAALDGYWRDCLEPDWWPRVRSVMEADLAHRSRVLAEQGAAALFTGLDPRLAWTGDALRLTPPAGARWPAADVRIEGRGMVLLPTLFARGATTFIDGTLAPVLHYPARGRATIAENPPSPAGPHALERLLGRPRARLLLLLAEPATTTELAHRLDVTPGAVSQHLAVLHDAGLLTRTRSGRAVRYARTRLGEELCRR